MKSVYAVLLLAALIALARAFPGAPRDSAESTELDDDSGKKDGVVIVLPPRRNIFDEFGDSDADSDDESSVPNLWHPFRFNKSSFQDIFLKMQETMNRIRAEMAAALASQLGQGGLTPWGKIPEGANTTSTTKIIGDHSVTINETTYTDGDENGGTIFRVRVVDVKPLNETSIPSGDSDSAAGNNESSSEEEQPAAVAPTRRAPAAEQDNGDENRREEITTPASRSVETVEEFDNEIYNKNQVETLNA